MDLGSWDRCYQGCWRSLWLLGVSYGPGRGIGGGMGGSGGAGLAGGLISTFSWFLAAVAGVWRLGGTGCWPVSLQIWDFPNISVFLKILSVKSFGNSPAHQVCYNRYQVSFYLWLIGSVLKHCKIPKYYFQDCRWFLSGVRISYKRL